MKRRALLLGTALVTIASCKNTKEPAAERPPVAPNGSAAQGSGSSAVTPNAALTMPHGVPLTGEALAKHFSECIASINARKVEDVKQHCVDPEIAIHEVDFDDFQGADVTLAYFDTMRTAMPDWKITPQLVLVSGRNIHAVNLVTGTHTGPLKLPDDREVIGTGNKIGLLMVQHLQTNDQNKTVEEWDYMDHHTFQDQVGQSHSNGGLTRPVVDKSWTGAPIVLVPKDDGVEQANLALVTKLMEAFNTHNAADVAAMWAEDGMVSDQASHEDQQGKAAITMELHTLFAAFPDAKATITHAVAAGDYVFVESSLTGTHKAQFQGIKATNKPIDASLAELYKIKNGKVTELWRFQDRMAMTAQLTAPAPDKVPSPSPKKPQGK